MGEIFFSEAISPCTAAIYARQYLAVMDSQQVRAALRQLRTDAKLTPEEFADSAGVSRATVYRIEELNTTYAPRIETVSQLVKSRDLTLSAFFARIEGLSNGNVSDTLQSHPVLNQQGNHATSDPVRHPLDDTNAIIARNTAALDELIEAVRLVSGELRTTREQNASARARKSAKNARGRKTGG